jgi:uncharacterized protein YdiU (UPF0061 family)
LGDGRAIILAEIENKEQVYTLQLKGAGMTLSQSRWFSSTAFFYTAFVQRSHVSSRRSLPDPYPDPYGDQVLRDVMYDETRMKRRRRLQGSAIIHRFGNFELFSSQSDLATLKTLADFTIKYHFPKLKETDAASYVQLFNP